MKTKAINQLTGALLAMFVIIAFAISACSSEDSPDPDPVVVTSVNEYLQSLPSWETFSPTMADVDFIDDPMPEFDCDDQSIQTTTPCSITQTPEDIVTHDPGSEILYLGSLIQGNGYIGGLGSIRSLPIYERAPLSISISFQMSNNSRTVDNPNLTTVKQAVAELVETAQNAGHVSGSSIYYKEEASHSLKQTAIALGLSYKFMKGSVKTQLDWSSTQETNTVSAYFKQKMFTVSMGIPQRPSDIFNSDFTQTLLDEQINMGRIGPDNLPVYVSNIVYGRMMMLTMTSTYSETDMKAALDATAGSFEGNIDLEHLNILNQSDIKLVTIGGDASAALGFLETGELKQFFKNDAPLTTAVPISYTLRNLGDNVIAKVSETTDYDMVQYDEMSDDKISNFDENQFNDWSYEVQASTDDSPLLTLVEWLPTRENVQQANESGTFELVGEELFMYNKITISGSETGFPFDFHLKNTNTNNSCNLDKAALVHNDFHAGVDWFPDGMETISIGDIGQFANDDFEIEVSSDNVYAIGLKIVGNTYDNGECFKAFAIDASGQECQVLNFENHHVNNFRGIVSPVPIKRIEFDEGAVGDDIAIRNIYFGYK